MDNQLYERIFGLIANLAVSEEVEKSLGVVARFDVDPDHNRGTATSLVHGYSLGFDHDRVLPSNVHRVGYVATAAYFYSGDRDGFAAFEGLPVGFTFGTSRRSAEEALGAPIAEGGGKFSTLLKRQIPKWTLHSAGPCVLHFEYSAAGAVQFVTLMNAETHPKQLVPPRRR